VTVPTNCPSGGGGLTYTLADYLKFCNCMLNNGAYPGGQLLSRKTVAWMTTNHIPEALLPLWVGPNEGSYGFGLGFRVQMELGKARALMSEGDYGWSGAANTYFWIDPAEDLIGLFMTQYMPLQPYFVQDIFRNLVCQAIVD